MKLVRLINMCLNETFSRVRVGKHLFDVFPISNGLKQVDALSPLRAFCPSVQYLLSSSLLSRNLKIKIYSTIV